MRDSIVMISVECFSEEEVRNFIEVCKDENVYEVARCIADAAIQVLAGASVAVPPTCDIEIMATIAAALSTRFEFGIRDLYATMAIFAITSIAIQDGIKAAQEATGSPVIGGFIVSASHVFSLSILRLMPDGDEFFNALKHMLNAIKEYTAGLIKLTTRGFNTSRYEPSPQ